MKKILIIEDDQMLIKNLLLVLKSEERKLSLAIDGETGLALAKTEKPDLILLDLIIPKIDGFAVLEKLKNEKETKNIPVLILSNLGQAEEIKRAMALGATDYMIKANVDLSQIIDKVKTLLNKVS